MEPDSSVPGKEVVEMSPLIFGFSIGPLNDSTSFVNSMNSHINRVVVFNRLVFRIQGFGVLARTSGGHLRRLIVENTEQLILDNEYA